MDKKAKIIVGMSGGVDSSVSAYLLKRRGFDVAGVFIETWHPDGFPCSEKDERRDAMRVAAYLDIPLFVVDAKKQYKKFVADEMIAEYKSGRTPNPDILCNKFVKFETLFQVAKKLNAQFVATGHYASTSIYRSRKGEKEVVLSEPKDKEKDQTYFLWAVPQEKLQEIIFPLENLSKKQVRAVAKKAGIPVAEKKDSQGICFLGPLDLKEYLKLSIKEKRGKVLNENGKVIGFHNGVWFYTEGERHGFQVSEKGTDDEPMYVLRKEVKKNILVVGGEKSLSQEYTIKLSNVALNKQMIGNASEIICSARFRYRQKKQKIKLFKKGSNWFVSVKSPTPLALGQSAVFYTGKNALGGGILSK
ncbi:MAG: tRNA 2-thiouridine(34) synthase MnmA [Minisyncoccia bacterium]